MCFSKIVGDITVKQIEKKQTIKTPSIIIDRNIVLRNKITQNS